MITSADGDHWQSATLIKLSLSELAELKPAVPPRDTSMDLRDPKLYVDPDGQLTLLAGLYYNDLQDMQSLVWFSRDGQKWSKPEFLTLPSGGDSSYAGLAWHGNLLWVSYYSSHEGKAAIYLARVRFGG